MKIQLLIIAFMTTSSLWSSTRKEFDESLEKICHEELKTKGCVNKNDDENNDCSKKMINQLRKECQELIKQR
jgi:hypothetical protein